MKRIVHLGMGEGGLWLALAGQELPAGARLIERAQARFWLRQSVPPMAHPNILHALSEIADALGYPFHGAVGLWFDELPFILDALESAIRDGRLVAFHTASLEGGGKGPSKGDEPKPEEEKKSWIKVKLADDLALQALSGVTATLTLSDGQERDFTTRNDGLIEVNGIPPGTCDAAGKLQGAKLPTTLTFMGMGETAGGKKDPDDEPIAAGSYVIAKIETYKVKKGDTLDSIAAKNGLTGQDLAIFNFGSSDPAAVNTAIRARVGSKTLGADKKTFVFDDADKPGILYIPKEWKETGLATEKVHTVRLRPVVPRWLALLKVDDHFAPSKEKLNIKYSIGGLSKKKVWLEIKSDHYKSGPIFKRELTADEIKDGEHEIEWDGKANTTSGDLKDHYIHPLFGPYKVHIYVDKTYTDEAEFKVLYHSVTLAFAPHTPDGKAPPLTEKEKYAQYRLNELGYDAGPVDGNVTTTVAKNAIKRFQRANYKKGTQTLLAENGNLDADTFDALQVATARVRFEAGKDPLKADCKLYVDDNYFNDRGVDFVTGGNPEFNSMDRKRHVEDKLERPYVPLEIAIKLVGKAGGAVDAPEAVGPVTVAWEADDGPEDASVIAATNGTARTFVANAIKNGFTGAAPINQTGDNAPKTYEGFRESAAADNVKSWFPNDAASTLVPWKVRGYDTETRGGKTFHRALVNAWAHLTDHPDRRGRAGVYFRHTFKGGDDAKVRAAITFEGLPNKDKLVEFHKPYANDLFKETGRWTIWRRAKMNAYCQQAAPSRASGSPTWGTIRDWWHDAFIEMENNGNPASNLNYGTVVTEAVYKAAIMAMPASHRPASATSAANITYRASSVYGGPALAQNPGEAPQAYLARVMTAMEAWVEHPINAVLGVIHGEVRKTEPEGLIVYDFRIHDPVTAQVWDPTLNSGAGGFTASPNPAHQNRLSAMSGYVRLDGAVTMCVDNPFNVNCYVLHECGHARFLYHHKTGGGGAANASDNPTHHDPAQERCAMSYGIGADTPDQWQYPFCGKCILRLRGWKVT